MRYYSTRDSERTRAAGLREAVLSGLAPDGGLFLPERLPHFPDGMLTGLRGCPFPEVAGTVASHILGESLGEVEARALAEESFTFPVPVVELSPRMRVVELFHGPTGSFKDFGAVFLAGLFSRLREHGERIRILVATSGDTGGAVARAVHGIPGVDALILFPEGRVSPVQLGQIAGAPGVAEGSVRAVAVRGSFDDCQRMVKEALLAPRKPDGVVVTSANSVNIGRLLPQLSYHVHAWAQHPADQPAPLVSVPSGNLGNLTAGVMAWQMGLPVEGFVAAMNENQPLGRKGPPPPSRPTLSSAMDVTDPSNLERLHALFPSGPEALAALVAPSVHTDEEVREEMERSWREAGYLIDPHTAVGILGLRHDSRHRRGSPGVVLATADPWKFPDAVRAATGESPPSASAGEDENLVPEPGFTLEPRTESLLELLRSP